MDQANSLHMEEVSWRQKVREKWLKEGNKNTKYFHCLASHRRRYNYVEELKVEDRCINGNEALREEVKGFYQKLYEEEFKRRPRLDGLQFKALDEISRINLEKEFSKEEIVEGLTDYNGDKSTGPYGFNMRFLQDF